MAISITIGGVDRTNLIDAPSVVVNNNIAVKSDTMTFVMRVKNNPVVKPRVGQEVVFYGVDGTTKEFAGILAEVEEIGINPVEYEYQCECVDYSRWLDKKLVVENYPTGSYAGDIVADLVSKYAPSGFTTNNVQKGFPIGEQKFDWQAVSDCIQALADATGFTWWVDYDKDVHFVLVTTNDAPQTPLLADSDTWYSDLRMRESLSQVKNVVYIKDFRKKSSYQFPFATKADGQSKFFALGYEPSALEDMTVQATVGGVLRTYNVSNGNLKTDTVDGQPGDGKTDEHVYVCFDNRGIRFNNAPDADTNVSATFNYMQDAIIRRDHPEAIAEMATREAGAGDGIYEFCLSDPSVSGTTQDAANARAELVLFRYAYPRLTGSFRTTQIAGWRAGQRLRITSVVRDIDQDFYVHKVTKRIINDSTLRYDIDIGDTIFAV